MADNKVLPATGTGTADIRVTTRAVTYSGDAADMQVVGLAAFAGSDDAKTVADIPGDAANGLDVDVTRLPAGTVLLGNVGSKQTRISVTPTVSTSPAYTAKDAVGGIMTFANAVGVSGGTGILQAVTVVDLSQQMPALDLVLFDQTIAGTVTDNSPFDPTDGDLANVIAVIPIAFWYDFNDNSVAYRGGLAYAFKANATSIFGALVARGTPTFVGTSDIIVILEILQDA